MLPHNENTKDGIREIMRELHTRVPGHGTPLQCRVTSAGDLLTCSRESAAQENVRESSTLDGLMPVIADFHLLANFYEVCVLNIL